PTRHPRSLQRSGCAVLELDGGDELVVDLAAGDERTDERRDGGDLTDEVARQVDQVRAEVAERAGAGLGRVEAPARRVGVPAPGLQVAAAEVNDLAQLAGLEQLPREPDCRHKAVVEAAEVAHSRARGLLPELVRLVGGQPEGFLADEVLARTGGRE